jgi:signal transduction histidine kinase
MLDGDWSSDVCSSDLISASQEGDGTRLTVADDGIGFAQRQAAEILSPFKRLNSRRDHPGTGIGLSIVKTIADLHGWTIEVEAAEMRGARFTVRFAG